MGAHDETKRVKGPREQLISESISDAPVGHGLTVPEHLTAQRIWIPPTLARRGDGDALVQSRNGSRSARVPLRQRPPKFHGTRDTFLSGKNWFNELPQWVS